MVAFYDLVTGVLLSIFYYTLMVKQLRRLWLRSRWRRFAGPLMLAFIVLGSIGIYIGRFLRFHSVHFFTEPLQLLERFVSSLNRDSLLFIGWMTLLQLLLVWVFAPRPADEGGKP
ncbi:DUF1361 domain-containing protein [Paenibacillus sp. SCIV0701]|uniref:DUF1361 domain-containing protein n=1 Tax=Paenibacillus soyae TaxID=2969249 RepID=A0A9X2MKL6_9BACL|nr:DUF1361 domain-containing protein [Paenibacillus soyae]MCR2802391.1 DUF1361 domain-containing protein [Paenibacillus soyae]